MVEGGLPGGTYKRDRYSYKEIRFEFKIFKVRRMREILHIKDGIFKTYKYGGFI